MVRTDRTTEELLYSLKALFEIFNVAAMGEVSDRLPSPRWTGLAQSTLAQCEKARTPSGMLFSVGSR